MNLLSAIGSTPLVELNNLNGNSKVRIFGKLEGGNPGGSIKDRPAYYMLKKAEESGELIRGKIILEPTSGNTGIALVPKIYHSEKLDEKITVEDNLTYEITRLLATKEGIFVGMVPVVRQ